MQLYGDCAIVRSTPTGADMDKEIEVRFVAVETRANSLEADARTTSLKIDQALEAIVDVHDDVKALCGEFRNLRDDLPEIIARAVAHCSWNGSSCSSRRLG